MLVVENDFGHENAMYYLRHVLIQIEEKCNWIEKLC
jgi:hypothetical protein